MNTCLIHQQQYPSWSYCPYCPRPMPPAPTSSSVKVENDPVEEGYKILAKDPEMQMRRKFTSHHCSFDFGIDQQLATCTCGMISTNPYYIKGKD